jgi:hypothetical protein
MKINKEIERAFYQEFPEILPNAIWKNDNGSYSVFGHYCIVPEKPGYRVYCSATDVGVFNSTKTALSWCIADKYQAYNLARELLEIDIKLSTLNNDIASRATIADRSNNWNFRDAIGTKLETKIIRKKQLENQLAKSINWAKYIQQRGFENETARTGRNQPNKTSR